jgi:hypothetical protein
MTTVRSPMNANTRDDKETVASTVPFTSTPPQADMPYIPNRQFDRVGHESLDLTHPNPLKIFGGWESEYVREVVLAAVTSQVADDEQSAIAAALNEEMDDSADYGDEGSQFMSMAPASITRINEWLTGVYHEPETCAIEEIKASAETDWSNIYS